MLHRSNVFTALLFAAALAASASSARAVSDDAPAWLKQAASSAAPTYDKRVPAVVLYKERDVTISDDGRVVTTTSYAVRILTREGRDEARAHAIYTTGSGKVRDLKAWLIRSTGEVKRYGKDQTLDVALAEDDVYNEARVQFISARDDVSTSGDVFGYQAVTEERTVFTQDGFDFQDELPALVSRFSLTLPEGWHASGVLFNHAPVEPSVAGATYTWEMKDLPYIESEPNAPTMSSLAPRLAVSFYPPEGETASMGPSFKTWAEVSRWLSTLHDPQAEPDDALAAKARALTADCKTDLEKIRAIGRYVQGVHYISIQMGVNRGGGMRPHRAADVFAKNYGDCKDKANLMRAMLRAVKLTAYPVGIYSGDRNYVREEWPSPEQFNHCIIAVKVGEDTDAPTVVKHPVLGRLLIFDPTDDTTPVGDLPDHEQGSFALLVAGDDGGLLRMPVTPPEANRLERTAEVTLQSDGSIAASVHDRAQGQAAVHIRRAFNWRSRPDFNKAVERWISAGTKAGAKLSKLEPTDSSAEGRFTVDVDFTAADYAQSMQDRLLVFKPAVVTHGDSVWLAEPTRKHPVVLESEAFSETVRFKLPAGFDVDELPDAVKLDSEFGTYTASYEVKDGQLVFTRSLVQRAATVPVEKYTAVRNFFGRVRASEQAPVVLARK
jgi:Domain of Unknown Function with PDB structure (DUF3857)/Transglutaminase-like superfamily